MSVETNNESSREHILVCLSSAPSNENIIRTGARMAKAFGGSFTALYVQTSQTQRMGSANQQRLQAHIRLAQELGAEISTVTGEEIAYQIAEFSRLSKVTKVVIGRSVGVTAALLRKKTLTEQLIELAPGLEIYIIPDTAGENQSQQASLRISAGPPGLTGWVISLGILGSATAIGQLFHSLHFTEANIITVYILGVLLTALFVRNYLCSMVTSLASVLLFNFFFTEPRLSFYAYESGYPVTFAIMLIASLITGTLANRLAAHAKQSAQSAWRTKVLFETSRLLQSAQEDQILTTAANQLRKLLSRAVIVYPNLETGLGPAMGADGLFSGEPELAQWVAAQGKRAGAGTEHAPQAQGQYLPVKSTGRIYGVLGIAMGQTPLEPFETSVLMSILGECALALENRRNAREKEAAAVLAKNEQLRSDLLRTISHDLRTPLTSISGNAENLLHNHGTMEEELEESILRDIHEDAIWLIRLVENLLAITRMGEGRTRLNLSAQLVDDVIQEAVQQIQRRNTTHTLRVEQADELLLARMDARLITQVIINLVDNALKYSPVGSTIWICAEQVGAMAQIEVRDQGPGIPDSRKEQVFEMFYTGSSRIADCRRSLGLGLALCRTIIEAHGGTIALTDNTPTGCCFRFTLPITEVKLYE